MRYYLLIQFVYDGGDLYQLYLGIQCNMILNVSVVVIVIAIVLVGEYCLLMYK